MYVGAYCWGSGRYFVKAELDGTYYEPTQFGWINNSGVVEWYETTYTNVDKTSIDTINGQSGIITCTRSSSVPAYSIKEVAYIDQIPSAVSELTNDAGYVTANAIPTNVSQLTNDAGYVTASEVSTSSLYPSSPYSAYVQIDDYGEVNAKKMLNQTDVWFIKAIMETSSTTPVTGYWVS